MTSIHIHCVQPFENLLSKGSPVVPATMVARIALTRKAAQALIYLGAPLLLFLGLMKALATKTKSQLWFQPEYDVNLLIVAI